MSDVPQRPADARAALAARVRHDLEILDFPGDPWPFLRPIHLFNWGSMPSLGISASSITGMKFGVSRLTPAITRDVYPAFTDEHARAFPWRESRVE
jgi:hypothetical protein